MSLLVFFAAAPHSGPAPTISEAAVAPSEARMIRRGGRIDTALTARERGKLQHQPMIGR